jgi:GR25 family glycosyltransferase involved in LPS biosynthesis
LKAVEGYALGDAIVSQYNDGHNDFCRSEMACTQSHILAWHTFLASSYQNCLVLEDDVLFCQEFERFWDAFEVPLNRIEIWKLETVKATCTIVKDALSQFNDIKFHQLLSAHSGAGSYLINRKTAEFLIQVSSDFKIMVDNELFDPIHRTTPMCRILQAVPAPCIQDSEHFKRPHLATTIGGNRNPDGTSIINIIRRKYLSPLVSLVVSILISYQGLKRIRIKNATMGKVAEVAELVE